jgi:hypothetical protein
VYNLTVLHLLDDALSLNNYRIGDFVDHDITEILLKVACVLLRLTLHFKEILTVSMV